MSASSVASTQQSDDKTHEHCNKKGAARYFYKGRSDLLIIVLMDLGTCWLGLLLQSVQRVMAFVPVVHHSHVVSLHFRSSLC